MGEAKRRRAMAQHMANSFPDDIKRDIAKTVRSIEWLLPDRRPAGMCFFRTMSGTINRLDIPAKPALGGMIYRAGPDEERDVVAFCGPGNAGTRIGSSFLGHWFIMSGDDIVDFSVGDWKALTAPGMLQDAELAGVTPLGSILWTGARPAGTSSAGLRGPDSPPPKSLATQDWPSHLPIDPYRNPRCAIEPIIIGNTTIRARPSWNLALEVRRKI